MKFNLLGFSSLGFLLLTTSLVDARTLGTNTDWSVRKVSAETPYCTLTREYEGNITFTIAKNKNNEGTLALDFGRNAFDMTRPYPVKISVSGVSRDYVTKAATPSVLIMRAGVDDGLFNALSSSAHANIVIDNEAFDINLSDEKGGFSNFDACLGNPKPMSKPVVVETKQVVPPRQPVETVTMNRQDNQIDQLLEENRKLTAMLTKRSTNVKPVRESASPIVGQLREQLQQSQLRNKSLLEQVAQLQSDLVQSRKSLNPDLSGVVIEKDKQIKLLIEQNQSLENALKLAQNTPQTVKEVIKEVEIVPQDMLAKQQGMQSRIADLEKQASDLMQQKTSLENQLQSRANDVVVKEVIKEVEVPVIKEIIKEVPVQVGNTAPINDSAVAMQLVEAETQAKSFQAERDEYRRLLQTERRRFREMGDVAGQIKDVSNAEGNLISDVRRLEKEKAELVRKLEHAKSTGTIVETVVAPADAKELNALSLQLTEAKKQLSHAEQEKEKLKKRMAVIDAEAITIQRQLAESKIAELADDSAESIQEELEVKTLRSEIAALEAQNNILRTDMMVDRQEKREEAVKAEVTNVEGRISRPVDREVKTSLLRQKLKQAEEKSGHLVSKSRKVAEVPSAPVQPVQIVKEAKVELSEPMQVVKSTPVTLKRAMVALSGDEIRQLIMDSKIPLATSIDRVDRVSGPDFAAFRWDTGFVYGSGEQSRLSDISAFNNSVQGYIQKTASRCKGSFDQNIQAVDTTNGLTVKSADIACVDDNAMGSAASILFFVRDGMFYALAHEADMNTFKVAMDMRDRLIGSIDQIF